MNAQEYDKAISRVKADPAAFRAAVLIDTDEGPKRLADCMDDWQRKDFGVIDPACRRIAGQKVDPPYLRVWLERGRGHSKTTDIAVAATQMLFASEYKIDGVACAADKDQAGLIRDAIDRLLRLNPWLADVLDVQQWKIINKRTGSTLTILSADVASSYGLLISFAILDECTHWQSRPLFDSIFSAIAKRKYGLLLVIANAGFRDHWAWELREAVRQDEAWYFHRLDGPIASWISPKHLEEQQRILLPEEYKRLWLNDWASTSGDSIDPKDIAACTTLTGPQHPRDDRVYVAGLDLGIHRDHSAVVVLSADPRTGMVEVAAVQSWNPADSPDGKVDLIEVRYVVKQLHSLYQFVGCKYDFWQAELMAQELQADGVPMSETKMPQEDVALITRSLLDAFSNRRIALYPHAELVRDLLKLRMQETIRGYKLTATRDEGGHADRAMALAFCLPAALAIANQYHLVEVRPEQLCA